MTTHPNSSRTHHVARTNRATRKQKSRLSIVIRTSGFAATTASAVSLIRRLR